MDLKVNSLGFQGKKEVLYGLNNAANAIHSYSVYRQPRLMQYGENKNLAKYEISAKAYLDMVTKDSGFAKSVSKFNAEELKIAKEHLEPYSIGTYNANPIEYFKEFIESVMHANNTNSVRGKHALEVLLEKLGSM